VKKHNAIRSFFEEVLGVEGETASEAACKAEHSLGPKIISRLISFNEFVGNSEGKKAAIAEKFHKYYSEEVGK
jgi:Mn-dependent DtxR family transcriptional regulator